MVEREREEDGSEKRSKARRPHPVTKPAAPASRPAWTSLWPGDHACALFSSEAEREREVGRFLAEGLRGGEKVFYAGEEHSRERVLGYLRRQGIVAAPFLKTRQLEIRQADEVYVPGGVFSPTDMISRIRALSTHAKKEGFRRLRVSGEMTWALRGWPGSERIAEYELRVNAAIAAGPCVALCQYDTTRFSSPLLREIRAAHPVVLPRGA